jgi:hypothetical protein
MTATQSLRLYDLFLKHFKNDADAKAFVNELEIVLEERSERDNKTYSNKNEIELLRKDFQILREEVKAGLAETKSELKTEINKLVIWIVATFLAGGGLMILIVKLFFEK